MIICAKVKPGSKKGPLVEEVDSQNIIVWLRERAHDGEANAALIKVLAKHYKTTKGSIKIKSGASGKTKLIEID